MRPRQARVAVPSLALLLIAPLLAGACNESERVDLVFRAPPGSEAAYAIDLESTVVTELAGPPETSTETVALDARQVVVGSGGGGDVALQITMGRVGERPRAFTVRLDTSRGVAEVDAVEGLTIEVLGELGPSRLILLASGLLPGRPLRPGGAWDINQDLELPEGPERLSGEGRLVGLRISNGVELARVRASTSLPVDRRMSLPQGTVRMSGVERTTAVLDYDVSDGTLYGARSVTTGRFALVVHAPGGEPGPIEGTLEVRVESRTRRAPDGSKGATA